jgi:hypothetical protein
MLFSLNHPYFRNQGPLPNPGFVRYDAADHELFDGSCPDFHVAAASGNALDKGTVTLPDSLNKLLDSLGVTDFH